MNEKVFTCDYCKGDPYEYATVDGGRVRVGITCCDKAIRTVYLILADCVDDINQKPHL